MRLLHYLLSKSVVDFLKAIIWFKATKNHLETIQASIMYKIKEFLHNYIVSIIHILY